VVRALLRERERGALFRQLRAGGEAVVDVAQGCHNAFWNRSTASSYRVRANAVAKWAWFIARRVR